MQGSSEAKNMQTRLLDSSVDRSARLYYLILKKPENPKTRNPHARSSVGQPLELAAMIGL